MQCACAHPCAVPGWSEYLGISGYSDRGGVQCACAHPCTATGWSENLGISGYSDRGGGGGVGGAVCMCPSMYCPGMVRVSRDTLTRKVGVIISNKCCHDNFAQCMYILRMAWRHWTCMTLRGAVICVLDRKQSELGTGQGSYAVILLVSPLVSLTIAKFNGVSEHCFVVAQLCAYTTFEYLVRILLNIIYINITNLQKWPHTRKQSIPGHVSPPTWPGYEASMAIYFWLL